MRIIGSSLLFHVSVLDIDHSSKRENPHRCPCDGMVSGYKEEKGIYVISADGELF